MGLYNEANLNAHRFSIIPTIILTLSYVMILKQGKEPHTVCEFIPMAIGT